MHGRDASLFQIPSPIAQKLGNNESGCCMDASVNPASQPTTKHPSSFMTRFLEPKEEMEKEREYKR